MADQDYNRAVGGTNWWDTSSVRPPTASSSSLSAEATSVMGLGLSSHPPIDHWTHPSLMTDKGGFRSMLQEGMMASPEFKPIKAGFSLDQYSHTSSVDSLNHLDSSSSSVYGNPTSTMLLQGLMGASDHHAPHQGGGFEYSQAGYGMAPPGTQESLMGSGGWSLTSNKDSDHDFLKTNSMVEDNKFNHGSFWNMAASAAASMAGPPRPATAFFPGDSPALINIPCFDEKPQGNVLEVRDTSGSGRKPSGLSEQTTASVATTSSGGGSTKRARNEASSTLPPFKVRKEKMGDRITALQQLVSPFGKTDTASVLSEAIEYIKFLHEQVNMLSTPYLKNGASLQHQQSHEKSKDTEGPRQDLRSRGLCLVPVSSTFPVAHETTVDFWTPTFGGTFR